MIQIITYNISKYNEYDDKIYKISELGEIQALDDFEICIIDLSDYSLWRHDGQQPNNVNCYKDLLTIKEAIINRNKSKILIVLPQNENFCYNKISKYVGSGSYRDEFDKSVQLKDNKENFISIIDNKLVHIGEVKLSFEKTKTVIENKKVKADFNFTDYEKSEFEAITFSERSKKITTINKSTIFITTLNILEDSEILKMYIDKYCKEKLQNASIPDWIKDVKFLNDEQLGKDKEENLCKIKKLEEKNKNIDKQLDKNLEYKSILYTTGDELVKVVLEILDEILEYDSSGFVDEKKEDFLIKKEDITFVGEIKGISSAIKNENVSQLEVHIQSYLDKLQDEGIEEKVKGLLIINHQRNRQLEDRQEVHEHQKNLAVKYGSLIVETKTLLKIYERYKLKELTKEECKKIFIDNIGLLEI